MIAASPRTEFDSGTFQDLLTRHRADLRSRVDSLRSSIKSFDEKCRIHFSRRLRCRPRRRSDSDLALCGQSDAEDRGAVDWATSESDTDESVIEVCPVSQKLRQSRTTQTSTSACMCNNGRGAPDFVAQPTQVRDASTQTTDGVHHISSFEFIPTLRDQVIRDQLLKVLETLASQQPRNGLHRPRARKHTSNSPLDKRCQGEQSRILGILNKLQIQRSISENTTSNSHEPKRRHLFKKKSKTKPNTVLPDIDQTLPEIENADDFGTACDWYVTPTSIYDYHAEDDLWRLAEEGKLPWKCDSIQKSSSKMLDTDSPIKLFYCNEVVSLFGPVRLFRRYRRQTIYPPMWVSIPPMLGVIPEH